MASDTMQAPSHESQQPGAALLASPRPWPAVVLVGLYWASYLAAKLAGLSLFPRFLADLAGCGLLTLLFLGWWLVSRRRSGWECLLGLGAVGAGVLLAVLLSPQIPAVIPWLLMALPWVFTVWAAWLVLAQRTPVRIRRVGLLVALCLTWGSFALVRMDGLTGEGNVVRHWRWTPMAEDLYLAERARKGAGEASPPPPLAAPPPALTLQAGDWPGFRGPGRDSTVRGVAIATDWDTAPPRLVWRQRVGPAWSSLAVVGGRLFTQEQRGDTEAVVCLDAATGHEIWAHLDRVRWWDGQAGAGPRATPLFSDGNVYALGATGILNCLDAATGKPQWSHDVAADAGVKAGPWGFASSPLVAGGLVVVFAGGTSDKSLLAYRAASGDLAWTAPTGKFSYSSPQLASLGGKQQLLFLSDRGLTASDPSTGTLLWAYDKRAGAGLPRALQPHPVGDGQVLIASDDLGTALLDVAGDGPTQRWTSRQLKPSFNDFVVHDGFIYGFDGEIFCCLESATGALRWKDGRYGHGQVLLLADQGLLLVLSEEGEAILVSANPDRHEERGRFQAIHGTTWNHPVIVRDHLYVRNAEQMACYELVPVAAPAK